MCDRDVVSADDIDLNLLRTLHALLETGSVTAAAERLHLSPPAVSRSLGRLRRTLDDPLFVRSGRDLVPTPLAESLVDDVAAALQSAIVALTPRREVDVTSLERRFTVAADDAIIAAIGLPLLQRVEECAPGVTIDFLTEPAELTRTLASGGLDIAVGPKQGQPLELKREHLLTSSFVAAMRHDHDLATSELTPATFAAAHHLTVSPHAIRTGPVDEALDNLGLRRERVTTVTSFVVAAHIVATTDLVGTLPGPLVATLGEPLGLVAVPLPVPTPAVELYAWWHERVDHEPAHRWLREQIAAVTAATVSEEN